MYFFINSHKFTKANKTYSNKYDTAIDKNKTIQKKKVMKNID